MDVTVVGSGPNGLSTAVICARAGLKVQVVAAQPTPGGGARTAADPEFPGVEHDICSAVHPLALASPFFAEFDLPARGVQLAVTATVERFAPGFRDVVVAARTVPAAHLSDHNANYVGGDIGMGGNSAWRAIVGPTPRLNPWRTPIPKAYLCSAATPPGGGVHGMAGYYAARSLLRHEFGIDKLPALGPG
jgi:phytoene dehydrogenase-like protein